MLGALCLSHGWFHPDFHFCCSQSFCKEEKLKILTECSSPLSNPGRQMQMDRPLDTWCTWHLSWKPTLPGDGDSHRYSEANSLSRRLHSRLWLRSLIMDSQPTTNSFCRNCFWKASSWWGSAWFGKDELVTFFVCLVSFTCYLRHKNSTATLKFFWP